MNRSRDECSSPPIIVIHTDADGEHELGTGHCWCLPVVRHIAQRWGRRGRPA
jgi:hypothetical protein